MIKNCPVCFLDKDRFLFNKHNKNKDGLCYSCRECNSKYKKEYYLKNRDRLIKKTKDYSLKNKDKITVRAKNYRIKNKKRRNLYEKEKKKSDIGYKLKGRLRIRLWNALKNDQKTGSAVDNLGCSVEFLKDYLEKQFKPGMTWENWSHDGWHIDHIIPLNSFDLLDKDQLLKACHYTNLQPLWAAENCSKQDN